MERPDSRQAAQVAEYRGIPTNATLFHLATGYHPLRALGTTTADRQSESNHNRFAGFPEHEAWLKLKRNAVDDIESQDSGSGPEGNGWRVKWRLFPEAWDKMQKYTLADLVSYLDPNALRLVRNTGGINYLPDNHGLTQSSTMTSSSVKFDCILISKLPENITPQALLHLPVGEITASQSFIFLEIPDHPAALDFCQDLFELWGFRLVENISVYAPKAKKAPFSNSALMTPLVPPAKLGGKSRSHHLTPEVEGQTFFDTCHFDLGLRRVDFSLLCSPYVDCSGGDTTLEQARQLNRVVPGDIFDANACHYLVGSKGNVKENGDGRNFHTNVESDVLLTNGLKTMTSNVLDLVESFCLGRRRLHLFGREDDSRRGWVTVGPNIERTTFDAATWSKGLTEGTLVRNVTKVDNLRPKSLSSDSSCSSAGTGGVSLTEAKPSILVSSPKMSGLPHLKGGAGQSTPQSGFAISPDGGGAFPSPLPLHSAVFVEQNQPRGTSSTFARPSGRLIQQLVHKMPLMPSRPSRRALHDYFGSHDSGANSSHVTRPPASSSVVSAPPAASGGPLSNSRAPYYQPRMLSPPQSLGFCQPSYIQQHVRHGFPTSIRGPVAPEMQQNPLSAQGSSDTYQSTLHHQQVFHVSPTSLGQETLPFSHQGVIQRSITISNDSVFNLMCVRAFQDAIALPESPPPRNWIPSEELHSFYYELAERFGEFFYTALVEHQNFNDAIFDWEKNRHITRIFRTLYDTWSKRPLGSMEGLSVDPTLPNASQAAVALYKATAKPDHPPKANWKIGERLHPYYESILHRFEKILRQMLRESDYAVQIRHQKLDDAIDHACEVYINLLRVTWYEKASAIVPGGSQFQGKRY